MKALRYISFFLAVLSISCKTEPILDKQIGEYDRDGWERIAVDEWLTENFTDPYNIEVKYRWDASEFAQNRTFVPVEISQIQPFMSFLKAAVIDVTVNVNGADFVKKHFPKQLMLAGSYFYNVDGTIYAGIAENARKVFLFGINDFGGEGPAEIRSKVRIIYHELTHILHQKVMYPVEFKTITPGAYTSNWNAVSLQNARNAGFMNAYSMSTPNEDFAEIAANILVNGRTGFEAIVATANEEGQTLIWQKTAVLVNYFAQVWNVDIWEWADHLADKIDELVEEPTIEPDVDKPLYPQLGVEKAFESLIIDMEHPSVPAQVKSYWNQAAANLVNNKDGRRFHNKFSMRFTSNHTVQLVFYYFVADGRWSIPQRLNYHIMPQPDGSYRFAYFSSTSTAPNLHILPALDPFLKEWFDEQTFLVDWADATVVGSQDDQPYAQIKLASDPDLFLVGELGNVDLTVNEWPFPVTHLYDQLGSGSNGLYTTFSLLPTHSDQSSGFQVAWSTAAAAVRATNGARTLKEMALYVGATLNEAQLVVYYSHTLSSPAPTSRARYSLNFRIDENGFARISIASQDANGAALRTALQPFLNKYITHPDGIYLKYVTDDIIVPPTGQRYGMIAPSDNIDDYVFGLLTNFSANQNIMPPFN